MRLLVCQKYKGDGVNCPHWSCYSCECSLIRCVYESFTVDSVSFNGSSPRNEFEIKNKIVDELQKLKSDKPGYINTIGIDRAIDIVLKA